MNTTPVCKCSFIRTSISNYERVGQFISRKCLVDRKLTPILFLRTCAPRLYIGICTPSLCSGACDPVLYLGSCTVLYMGTISDVIFVGFIMVKCDLSKLVPSIICGGMYCFIMVKCHLSKLVPQCYIWGYVLFYNGQVICIGVCYSSVTFGSIYCFIKT